MKQLLSLTALTVFTCAAAIAQGNNDRQLVMDRTLPSNGTVVLDMNVGDVKIAWRFMRIASMTSRPSLPG
jgi:hypothetical protein